MSLCIEFISMTRNGINVQKYLNYVFESPESSNMNLHRIEFESNLGLFVKLL